MSLVRLICWKEDLARERAALLKAARLEVDASPLNTSRLIGRIMENPPSAIVIDLDRMPSHGLAVGVVLRRSVIRAPHSAGIRRRRGGKSRPHPPGIARCRLHSLERHRPSVRRAVKSAPADPVKPRPLMERYESSGLVRKLGLKPGMVCALIQAPEGFEESIDDLPEDSRISAEDRRRTPASPSGSYAPARKWNSPPTAPALRLPQGASLWIVYPKRSGRYSADFTLTDVRAAALSVGLVDYKICAVDDDWTGLKFARRKK